MELLDEIVKQYRMLENSSATMLMEIERKIYELERLKMNENESKRITSHESVMIPLAAYEMQLERFDVEKDKKRKHYKTLVMFVTIPLVTLIIAIFATVIWFFSNYDFASYNQDGDGINNYLNSSSQGDVRYEPIYPGDYLEESLQGEGSLDK